MTGSTDSDDGEDAPAGGGGRRLVLTLYALLVGVGTVGGALVPVFVDELSAPALFGLFTVPLSPLGFALYGGVTVAVVLGVPLSLVVVVSRTVGDPHAIEDG
ncbi:DUF7520 family protein [Halorarum halobium]|uniref:DUF7520 family protein n=1 Tax=Halorarum halobium TaxID=3075121 RepID=UPI0028A99292|nr:cox cluster protein [Halobaculum sp. XH14]